MIELIAPFLLLIFLFLNSWMWERRVKSLQENFEADLEKILEAKISSVIEYVALTAKKEKPND